MAAVTATICTYRGRPTAGSSLPLGTLVAEYTVALTCMEQPCVVLLTLIDEAETVVLSCRQVVRRNEARRGSVLWRELTMAAIEAAKAAELRGAA
jgi:hypothetical protein